MCRFAGQALMAIGLLAFAGQETRAVPVAGEAVAPPPEVRQIQLLMQSPAFRSWLEAQPAPADNAVAVTSPEVMPGLSLSQRVAVRFSKVRSHLVSLGGAAPSLVEEFHGAGARLAAEFEAAGTRSTALSLALVAAAGIALEGLYLFVTREARRRIAEPDRDASKNVLRRAGMLATHRLSGIAILAAGILAGLLAFEHPPLLRQIALVLLFVAVATRLGFLLAASAFPPIASAGVMPEAAQAESSQFMRRRLGIAIGVAAFGCAVTDLLAPLGFSAEAREILTDLLALALVGLGLEAAWRRPKLSNGATLSDRTGSIGIWAFTIYLVALWLLFVADMPALFWPMLLAYVLPKSLAISGGVFRKALIPADMQSSGPATSSFSLVYAERFIRVLIVIGAALLLAYAWEFNVTNLTSGDTLGHRLLRGVLSSVVILFVADLLWHITKTFIDRTVAASTARTGLEGEAAAWHARLRTLLPILRNMLFIVIATFAVLMALTALGVAIGPLIAGAGVIGVAIGFGSQTLVKDILSGIFYMLDDAFRAGEYIESGSYTGTVESFSLRSVRLRHPRGGVFTVPFGELGAIKNLSRDWAIDKFTVNVRYDTDFALAKRLVKEVSAALLTDPDVGQSFIAPLKMQGIQELGAYSVALRLKMTVRPGEQSTIRRKVLAMVKASFEKNGIEFPLPIVQVEALEKDTALVAAAQQALRLTQTAVR